MRNFRVFVIVARQLAESSKNILLSFSLLLLLSLTVAAQTTTTSHSDIATPGGLAAGSPSGAYQLSGFENVNLYNGNLDFHLPLIAVGGRGSAAFPITLSLNTKQWHTEHTQTESSETWYPSRSYWGSLPGYSAGVMQGRRSGFGIKNTAGCSGLNKQIYQTTLTTLTFTGPDGTEYGFRDQLNGGQRMAVTAPCPTYPYTGASRGTVWVTADGSAATFISDAVIYDLVDVPTYHRTMTGITGYLLLRDGTKYRIEGGGVSWIRDRNGNLIYNQADSLGRQFPMTVVGEYPTYEYQISYKGFGGANRVIRITHDLLQNALRPGFSIHTPAQLFPDLPSTHNFGPFNPLVVTSVILPNGQSYQFKYNDYGELARVVLPTGGAIEYDMTAGSGVIFGNNGQGDDYEIYRRVVERRTYKDGSATPVTRTVYVAPADGAGPVEVKHYDGSNGVLTTLVAVEKHYFATNRIESLIPDLDGQGFPVDTYPAWNEGKETVVESYATDGTNATTLLRRTVNNWQTGATLGGFPVNPRIADTTTTLSDTNQVSKQVFAYDQCTGCNSYFNNQTDVYEYDYGSGAPAAQWTRRTHTDYVTATNYIDPVSGAHLRSLPSQVSVFDGGGVERSRTVYEYDNYNADANHAALVDRANIINLDSAFTTSYLTRGNGTAITGYFLNNGTVTGSITSYAQYDIAGNVVKTIDGRGYATLIDYSDRFGAPDGDARANSGSAELNAVSKYSYAFATFVQNAAGHTAYAQFDYYLGQPVDGEDANGIVASGFYNDALDRPTQVVRANNQDVSVKSQATFAYDDTNRIITTSGDQDSFNDPTPLKGQIVYDGLGRTTEKRQFENASDFIAVRQTYDGLGRNSQTSNPFRATESVLWTTTGYDALSRTTSVTTPDSAAVSTSYSGNTVIATDQAGKQRKSVTDALGRLKEVYEDPAGLNYVTSYSYDVLDNLTTVNQGTQARYFMYDSLKRLLRVKNPEQDANASLNFTDPLTGNSQWSMAYNYDNNGNLTVKTDARGVQASYTYDALNRNTSIVYSNDPQTTPRVNRYYDGSVRGIGRLTWEETVGVFAKVVDVYDVMGQPVQYRQRFWVNNDWGDHFWGFASYDKAGHLTTMTYPSGRTVTNTYDGAGRLASLTGNLGDGTSRTYSSGVSYSSFGGMTQEQFGTTTPIYNKRHYNIRGQLYDVRASTFSLAADEFNWNRGCIALYYGGAAWGQSSRTNNGNVTMQQHWVPTDNPAIHSYVQDSYAYDSLNRLTSVTEVHGNASSQSGPDFQQTYNYDRWGNRTIDGNPSKTWGANINSVQAVADHNTNRMYAPNDPARVYVDYDAAGNQTKDYLTSNGTRTFDAENRMKSATNNGITSTYTYDGNGKRIKRNIGGGAETWQVYGIGGELLAEYAAHGAPSSPQKEYGYRNGELLVTAEPGTPQGGGGEQNVTWTNAVAVSVSGNSLTKTAAIGWGNSGASSTQSISSGDGYVEFTATETNTLRMCGLSVGDTNQDYTDIDFAFYPWQDSVLYIFEGGVSRGTFGTYAVGDKLRVAVEGGVVKYRKNGALLYTSTVTPSYPLLADTSLFSTNGTISNAVIGTGPVNVSWTNAVGLTVSGNSLTKTAALGWGNSGASSTQSIRAGDGYVEFTTSETNMLRMCGLNAGDANRDYTDIDFAFYPWQDGLLYIFEGGVSRGSFGTYASGDRLRVAVESGVVKYRKNGALIYTSTVTPTYPLLADTSLYSNGATLTNVVISGASGGGSPANIRWLVTDHLGTPRIILDQTASLANVSRHDYLPFGEELFADTAGRTTAQGYTLSDNVRQKFTSQERDNETGLDYFEARYYSSIQGRFTSTDPPFADQEENDPQSWNLYSYVRNNPLKYIDPFGDAHWELWDDGQQHYVGDEDGEYDKDLNAVWVADGAYWDFQEDPTPSTVSIPGPDDLAFETFPGSSGKWIIYDPQPPMGGGLRDVTRRGPGLLAKFGSRLARLLGVGKRVSDAVPQLSGATGREMLRDAIRIVRSSGGSASEKAELFEKLAIQIMERTGGSWNTARVAGTDGSTIFIGRQNELLVVSPTGELFRGAMKSGGAILSGEKLTPVYDALRRIN